jgi:hypothetical protein
MGDPNGIAIITYGGGHTTPPKRRVPFQHHHHPQCNHDPGFDPSQDPINKHCPPKGSAEPTVDNSTYFDRRLVARA